MENNKQLQKAGDNSQQLQMVNPIINVGITEERVREIFSEMNAIARQSYTQDAYELAMKRVGMFEELLMSKVEQVDGMLEAFRDPSFQLLLVEAQKRAADVHGDRAQGRRLHKPFRLWQKGELPRGHMDRKTVPRGLWRHA